MPADRGPAGANTIDGVAELARNGGRGRYRAQVANAAAFRRAQRPKPAKLVTEPRLREVVEAKLALRWSSQQIAGWLPLAHPQDWSPLVPPGDPLLDAVDLRGAHDFRHSFATWLEDAGIPAG